MRNAFLRAVGIGGAVVGMTAYVAVAQPKPLISADVGTPLVPGSVTVAGGKITVVGSGSDIWNASDNFHYAYFRQVGDFDYVMKVESLTGCSGDGGWSKVELMARKDSILTPGAGPAATDEHISNMTTRPSSDTPPIDPLYPDTTPAAGVNNRGPQFRAHDSTDGTVDPDGATWGGQSSWTSPNPAAPPNMPNNWVRMERVGPVFYLYYSNDGTNWAMYNPWNPQGFDTRASWPAGADNAAQAYFTNAWPNDIMVGIAVTAHTTLDGQTSTAVVSDFKSWTPVPIAITQQPPASISAAANSRLSMDIAATGDPVHYEWRKDGTPISRAVTTNYSVALAQQSDSGTYICRVFGGGTEIMSTPCIVTITNDVTKPTLVEALGSANFTSATIRFSEPVTAPTATTAGNYTIAGLTVSNPVLSADGFSVTLTTSLQTEGADYVVTVNNVQDNAGNVILANSQVGLKAFSFLTGNAIREQWPNAGSHNNLDTFIQYRIGYAAAPEEPIAPSTTVLETSFECPTAWAFGDNYGGRLSGWFIPPVNGNYVFYCTSDDGSFLMLSSDDKPANKRKIAREPSWNNSRAWIGTTRRDGNNAGRDPNGDGLFLNQSNTWPETEWGASAPGEVTGNPTITLVAGRRYYIEGLWQDGTGGDGFGATYRLETEDEATTITDNTATRITGALIGTYADTSKLPPTISSPTASAGVTLDQGGTTTFTVVGVNPAAGSLNYQWTRNGFDITGANQASYVITNAKVTDMGQYRCKVSNANGTVTSQPWVLLVNATGVFAIEGEDFDFNNGQSMPAASVMPYYGGAYEGLSAVRGVDYMNDDDPGNNMRTNSAGVLAPVYRYGGDLGNIADDPNTGATIGGEQPGGQFAITRAGEWTMTNNFKLGWVGNGNWGNYTRTFPTPAKTYNVVYAGSGDSLGNATQLSGALGKVTAGVGTTTQTIEPIGVFQSEGTGAWSRNNLVVMTDVPGGAAKTVELGGTVTLRWTYNSGDSEYLLFIPTGTVGAPTLTPTFGAGGTLQISYAGGVLVSSDTANGTYAPVAGAVSPYTVDTTAAATRFYQVRTP